MAKPKVLVLRTAGTNCDKETAFAFSKAQADTELVHINQLKARTKMLSDYQILAIPGGFSYGDDIAAGKILANELRYKLADDLRNFIQDGKLIIGICNGFQVLVKAGILPGNADLEQEATLTINDSAKFEDRWVYLKRQKAKGSAAKRRDLAYGGKRQKCVWIKDISEIIYLPVAHGEGKFITKERKVLERLKENNQIVFQYCDMGGAFAGYPDNPNGSEENIAGICDETGRVLGLMPHPERHIQFTHHPRWTQIGSKSEGDGLKIFKNGVEYAKKYL